jgi:hypothetical protein
VVFLKKYGLLGMSDKPAAKLTYDEEVLEQDQVEHLLDARRTELVQAVARRFTKMVKP